MNQLHELNQNVKQLSRKLDEFIENDKVESCKRFDICENKINYLVKYRFYDLDITVLKRQSWAILTCLIVQGISIIYIVLTKLQ